MMFIFSTPLLIRHLWQLKTVAFLHWCLKSAVLLLANLTKTGPVSTLVVAPLANVTSMKNPISSYPVPKRAHF